MGKIKAILFICLTVIKRRFAGSQTEDYEKSDVSRKMCVQLVLRSLSFLCMSFLVTMSADNDARESAPTFRRVWYQLVGLTNEEPFGGVSIDRVTLNTNSYVFEVRDAIYMKDSRLFERVAISQLHLYENRSSFNKRIVIGERRAPLSPTTQVGSWGESMESPIIVFVPVVGFLRFSPCQVPVFVDILNATETDGSILFNHTIPSTTLKALYVRDCYVTIASSLKPGINKALITGTPGIGKSLFFIYLLWKLVPHLSSVQHLL